MINVLDHGYVRLVDVMGSDLSVVNAARVSFDKESDVLDERDERLIAFLAREGHGSPTRHAFLSFEVYAPLFVARQWWKHVVGSDHTMEAHNESSRRYVTEEPVFYMPKWRAAPENKKQGSGDFIVGLPKATLDFDFEGNIKRCVESYNAAIGDGVAPEQARCFLPAYAMYVRWRWSTSLQSVLHFLSLRLEHSAQWEIQQYAEAVYQLTEPKFPISTRAFVTST